MTLTKSYHNSFRQWWSVYTWSLKKQSGIGIIYLILLCLALPFLLGIILFSSIKNQHMLTGENIANGLHILFTFLIIPGTLLFVFITAVLLFRFMHNKRSTDFYHALPVSRTAMFFWTIFSRIYYFSRPNGHLLLHYGNCTGLCARDSKYIRHAVRYIIFVFALFG
mgnify:CR=1 FL=1